MNQQLGKLNLANLKSKNKEKSKPGAVERLLANGRSRSPRKPLDKVAILVARRDKQKESFKYSKNALRTKFGGGQKTKKPEAMSGLLDRNRSLQNMFKDHTLVRKNSE